MIRTVHINARSYQDDFDMMAGKACQAISTNGTWIGMNYLTIRRVEFIGESGVRLIMRNGIEIEAPVMSVSYRV